MQLHLINSVHADRHAVALQYIVHCSVCLWTFSVQCELQFSPVSEQPWWHQEWNKPVIRQHIRWNDTEQCNSDLHTVSKQAIDSQMATYGAMCSGHPWPTGTEPKGLMMTMVKLLTLLRPPLIMSLACWHHAPLYHMSRVFRATVLIHTSMASPGKFWEVCCIPFTQKISWPVLVIIIVILSLIHIWRCRRRG